MKKILDKLTWKWILFFYIINGIICSSLIIITGDFKPYLILFTVISIFTVLSVIGDIYSRFSTPVINEKIVCAAIHNPEEIDIAGNPLIYCGLRHPNILWQSKSISRNPRHQGFLTTTGRFVNREEALEIALKNNQVLDLSNIRGNNLYSEDLY